MGIKGSIFLEDGSNAIIFQEELDLGVMLNISFGATSKQTISSLVAAGKKWRELSKEKFSTFSTENLCRSSFKFSYSQLME